MKQGEGHRCCGDDHNGGITEHLLRTPVVRRPVVRATGAAVYTGLETAGRSFASTLARRSLVANGFSM